MRISKATKKTMSIAMAMAVAVTSITAVPANTASAKSNKVTARAYFAGDTKAGNCTWIAGDGKTAKAVTKTVTLSKGKKTTVTLTIKNPGKSNGKKISKIKAATVFTVDLVNVLSSYKKVKCSNISVKADGKAVKVKKVFQGSFEKNKPDSKNNWRLSFYNQWGNQGDNSAKTNKAKSFAFKKNLTVTFTVVAK